MGNGVSAEQLRPLKGLDTCPYVGILHNHNDHNNEIDCNWYIFIQINIYQLAFYACSYSITACIKSMMFVIQKLNV